MTAHIILLFIMLKAASLDQALAVPGAYGLLAVLT